VWDLRQPRQLLLLLRHRQVPLPALLRLRPVLRL
jgi:hypothetical protein